MSTSDALDLVAVLGVLADRLHDIDTKIDHLTRRIGTGANDESLSEAVDRNWDDLACIALDELRRDRLILAAVEGHQAPEPQGDMVWNLGDPQDDLDFDEVRGRSTTKAARALVAGGGVLPVTIGRDGERRR